ncbi:Hypothetical predicted protein, partial [Prunus dulcis]
KVHNLVTIGMFSQVAAVRSPILSYGTGKKQIRGNNHSTRRLNPSSNVRATDPDVIHLRNENRVET